MRSIALAGMALTGCLLLGGWRLVAAQQQEEISADPAVMPSLMIEVAGGPNFGDKASGGLRLERDGWNDLTLYAGDARSRSLCVGGVSTVPKGRPSRVPSDQQPLVVWTVSARLVSFDGDAATMDVRWRREPRSDQLQPARAHEGQLRWTAAEGVSSVLDLVRQIDPAEPQCESRSITMRFAPFDTSELSGQLSRMTCGSSNGCLRAGRSRTTCARPAGRESSCPSSFPTSLSTCRHSRTPGPRPSWMWAWGGTSGDA